MDLMNKVIYKKIKIDGNFGFLIIDWNNKYTIVGLESCGAVFKIEERKKDEKNIFLDDF